MGWKILRGTHEVITWHPEVIPDTGKQFRKETVKDVSTRLYSGAAVNSRRLLRPWHGFTFLPCYYRSLKFVPGSCPTSNTYSFITKDCTQVVLATAWTNKTWISTSRIIRNFVRLCSDAVSIPLCSGLSKVHNILWYHRVVVLIVSI
jgi:hypothetical protein